MFSESCLEHPNLGIDTFPDPIGHFGAPWRPFWILQAVRRCRRWASAPFAARLVCWLRLDYSMKVHSWPLIFNNVVRNRTYSWVWDWRIGLCWKNMFFSSISTPTPHQPETNNVHYLWWQCSQVVIPLCVFCTVEPPVEYFNLSYCILNTLHTINCLLRIF